MDTNQIIRKYLTEQTAITTLTGTRIYCPRAPRDADLTAQTIVFWTVGGDTEAYLDIRRPSVMFWLYGETPKDARALYEAVYSALVGAGQVNVTIGATTACIKSASQEIEGRDEIDADGDDTGWPRVAAEFGFAIVFPIT